MEVGSAFSAPLAAPRSPSADAGIGAGREKIGGKPDRPAQPGATSNTGEPLTKEQESQIRELKKRDAEVKAHEQAHAAVGGAYASAPTYTYAKGPDGKKYAVGGEVQIDTSPERTPDATIRKMDVVIRAALRLLSLLLRIVPLLARRSSRGWKRNNNWPSNKQMSANLAHPKKVRAQMLWEWMLEFSRRL